MSWIDNINNIQFSIITGEGSEFTPLWKNPSRSKDFNASVFKFNEIEGSLVRRGLADSFKIPVELHFTGEDHIEEANRFNIASSDLRPWTLIHPNYGEVLVQPISMNQVDSAQNDSVITVELYETIPDAFPDLSPSVQSIVSEQVDIAMESLAADFDAIGVPDPTLLSKIAETVNNIGNKFQAAAQTAQDLLSVQNALNDVLNDVKNITDAPVKFMNSLAELARTPAKFYAQVKDRIRVLEESFQDLKQSVSGVLNRQNKQYFEALGGALTVAKAEACVVITQDVADEQGIEDNTIVDFQTRADVITNADNITNSLTDYLETVSSFQTDVDATPDSYTPQQNGINAIKVAINSASGQLLQIAVQLKQERRYTLPNDTNLIVLVHRLYGNVENETIESFIDTNNLILSELIQIEKGREVIYFI